MYTYIYIYIHICVCIYIYIMHIHTIIAYINNTCKLPNISRRSTTACMIICQWLIKYMHITMNTYIYIERERYMYM